MSQPSIESRPELAQRSGSLPGAGHSVDLSFVCHELRTPLNVVVCMTWLLQHSGLNPVQQNYLREIQGASDRLLCIVNELLGNAPRPGFGGEPSWPGGLSDLAEDGTEVDGPTTAPGSCGQQPPDPSQDLTRWGDLRLQLMTLLRAADTDCIRLAIEHRSLLQVMLGAEYEAWSQALRNFDFDAALSLVEAWRTGPSVR